VKFTCSQNCAKKFCSLLCYSKFAPLRNFLFSIFSIDMRLSVPFLAYFIDFIGLECDARDETDNKWEGLRILDRYSKVQ